MAEKAAVGDIEDTEVSILFAFCSIAQFILLYYITMFIFILDD